MTPLRLQVNKSQVASQVRERLAAVQMPTPIDLAEQRMQLLIGVGAAGELSKLGRRAFYTLESTLIRTVDVFEGLPGTLSSAYESRSAIMDVLTADG